MIPITWRVASPTARWLVVALVLMCLDGVIRKWILPGRGLGTYALAYFGKDACLLLAGIYGLMNAQPCPRQRGLRNFLFIAIGFLLLSVLPKAADLRPVGSVVALRGMVFVPLVPLYIARGLRRRTDFSLVLAAIAAVAIVNGLVGAVQFYMPSTHWINQQPSTEIGALTASFENSVLRTRAFGTFAFVGGMADTAVIAAAVGAFYVLTKRSSWFGYLVVLAGLTCTLAAITRYGLLGAVLTFALSSLISPRVFRVAVGATATGGLLYLAYMLLFSGQSANLLDGILLRHLASDSFMERLSMFEQVFEAAQEYPVGLGLGIAQSADLAVDRTAVRIALYEFEAARLILDVGVIGMLSVMAVRVAYILEAWHNSRRMWKLPFSYAGTLAWVCLWAAGFYSFDMVGPGVNHIAGTYAAITWSMILACGDPRVIAELDQWQQTSSQMGRTR